jgi:hypothetical protein
MKAASFDDNAMISICNNLWCLNFLRCHSKKMISKGTHVRENSKSFCWIDRYNWNGDCTHYYRKLNTAGFRAPIIDGFGPCWCMLVVISDLYLRRLRASGDGILPPSVWHTIRRWWYFTIVGMTYHPAVIMHPSLPSQRTVRWWWCIHQR